MWLTEPSTFLSRTVYTSCRIHKSLLLANDAGKLTVMVSSAMNRVDPWYDPVRRSLSISSLHDKPNRVVVAESSVIVSGNLV